MANACDCCGKLYNLEDRAVRIGSVSVRTNVQFYIRRDGSGRPYLNAIDLCPDCADKVYKYIHRMNSEVDKPEYIRSGDSS